MDHLNNCCGLDSVLSPAAGCAAAENYHGCSHAFPRNFEVIAECRSKLGRSTALYGIENDRVSLLAEANKSGEAGTAHL
jgi:hypothetical protein